MKPVHSLLRSSQSLSQLGKKIAKQQALLKLVKQKLPQPLDDHCVSAVLQQQTLRLYADSPAWASRIRYLGRQLQQQLNLEGLAVSNIQSKVINLSSSVCSGRRHVASALSAESAEAIRSTAEFVKDPALKAALIRLSQHQR